MLGDDPQSYVLSHSKGDKVGSRDLWSLGWIYEKKERVHKIENKEKEDKTITTSESPITATSSTGEINTNFPNTFTTEDDLNNNVTGKVPDQVRDEAYTVDSAKEPLRIEKPLKGGKQTYRPFSTWSKDDKDTKSKKGGRDSVFTYKKQDSKKGGKITEGVV